MKSRDFENLKAKEAKLYILIANDMNKALRSIYFIVHVLQYSQTRLKQEAQGQPNLFVITGFVITGVRYNWVYNKLCFL